MATPRYIVFETVNGGRIGVDPSRLLWIEAEPHALGSTRIVLLIGPQGPISIEVRASVTDVARMLSSDDPAAGLEWN